MPKDRYSLLLAVKEIFKEATTVERRRVRVALPFLAKLSNPIVRFTRIDNIEETVGVEIRTALVIQNPEIIGFNTDHHIRLTRGQVWIPWIFPS